MGLSPATSYLAWLYASVSQLTCSGIDSSLNLHVAQLFIEPELRTNCPRKKLLNSEPPEERVYEPEGVGKVLKKGDEVSNAYILQIVA